MARPKSTTNLKNFSIEQLERLFSQIEKEKNRRATDISAAKGKILKLMKDFSLSVADFAEAEIQRSAGKKKKDPSKKATKKAAGAPKKAAVGPKKTRKKVAPKYANPEDKEKTWTGRGRQPLWVVAALESGKTMDDIKI